MEKYGASPVNVISYKLYSPSMEKEISFVFVIELIPFNSFENSENKRKQINK